MWLWIICGAIILFGISIIGAIYSCQHEWKLVRSGKGTYTDAYGGKKDGMIVLDVCEKCKQHNAYFLTSHDQLPVNVKWVKMKLNVK